MHSCLQRAEWIGNSSRSDLVLVLKKRWVGWQYQEIELVSRRNDALTLCCADVGLTSEH